MSVNGESRATTGVKAKARDAVEGRSAKAAEQGSNLTVAQQLIWLGLQLNPETPIYNMIHASTIQGSVNVDHFRLAFQRLVDESDAFRTVIQIVDGIPRQRVVETCQATLEFIDLSAEPDSRTAYQVWLAKRKRVVLDPG